MYIIYLCLELFRNLLGDSFKWNLWLSIQCNYSPLFYYSSFHNIIIDAKVVRRITVITGVTGLTVTDYGDVTEEFRGHNTN